MRNTTVETAAKKMKSASRETLQADGVQSRQTLFVRYCPRFVQDCFKKTPPAERTAAEHGLGGRNMGKSKKIIIVTVAGVTAAAVCVSGVRVWRH